MWLQAGGVKREGEGGAVEVQTVSLAAEFWVRPTSNPHHSLTHGEVADIMLGV